MKKFVTQLLYVFSFSLLFTALYLNFFQKNNPEVSYLKANPHSAAASASFEKSSAVAQPENNTVLK